eukprot:GILK01010028.1.p1 GENE.GILK01010028.1~~GILK01010028.1.p1  ORF type:complete len:996 (-),score=150.53 GILK01010028.1:36-2978(-)
MASRMVLNKKLSFSEAERKLSLGNLTEMPRRRSASSTHLLRDFVSISDERSSSVERASRLKKKPSIFWLRETESMDDMRLREKVALYVLSQDTLFGLLFQMTHILTAIGACVLYVYETYQSYPYATWIFLAEYCVALFFCVDLLLNIFISSNRLRYLLTFEAFVNVFSILAAVPFLFPANLVNFGFFRFFRIFNILRILQLYKLSFFETDRIPRQGIMLLCTIGALLFTCAGLVHLLESVGASFSAEGREPFAFHDAVYFVVSTASTVGFGDIAPSSWFGRLFTTCFIVVTFTVIPLQINQLFKYIQSTSPYGGRIRDAANSGSRHVILCGAINYENLSQFLTEFFHKDHGGKYQLMKVVLLCPELPSERIRSILDDPINVNRVMYLRGSALNFYDLDRAKAQSAEAVFVLTVKSSSFDDHDDTGSLFRALALRKFCSRPLILAQLLRPKLKNQMLATGADCIICIDEIKSRLLAASCHAPGLSTLICNLFRAHDVMTKASTTPQDYWLAEYDYGCSNDLLPVKLPLFLSGKTFVHVATLLYLKFGVLLVAVKDDSAGAAGVTVFPGKNYKLQSGPRGYVITPAEHIVRDIEKWSENDVEFSDSDLNSMLGHPRHAYPVPAQATVNKKSVLDELNAAKLRVHEAIVSVESGHYDETLKQIEHLTTGLAVLSESLTAAQKKDTSLVMTKPTNPWITDVESAGISNHVLLLGSVTRTELFFETLRATLPHSPLPVVVLHPSRTNLEKFYDAAAEYPNLWLMEGSSNREDLLKAGVLTAKTVVVLFKPSEFEDDHYLVDSNALLTNLEIESCGRKDGHMILELIHESNMKFVRQQIPPDEQPLHMWPAFAAGRIYIASVLDSLICHAFFYPGVLSILDYMLGLMRVDSPPRVTDRSFSVKLAEVSASLVDTGSNVRQIPAPAEFVGSLYKNLFLHLLSRNEFPIGLYRDVGTHGCSTPYVFTNPPPDCTVFENDMVFVVSASQ